MLIDRGLTAEAAGELEGGGDVAAGLTERLPAAKRRTASYRTLAFHGEPFHLPDGIENLR